MVDAETLRAQKREQGRRYRSAHRARVLVAKKAYYYNNRARILTDEKAKREANKDSFYERRRRRYALERKERQALARARYKTDSKHAARVLANNRKYRAARLDEFRERDKEYSKAYQARHPDRFVEIHRRANLTRRAVMAKAFIEYVCAVEVFSRDKGVCGICRGKVDPKSKWHIDHIVPLSKGGAHSYANVQLAHARCNLSKLAKLPDGQLGLFQKVCA